MAGVRDNTVTNVVSGGIASFKSVGQVPLKSLKVNFNPIQEGDGDPSPSNIRAISGWTGLNVFHTGKNSSFELGKIKSGYNIRISTFKKCIIVYEITFIIFFRYFLSFILSITTVKRK